MHFTLHVLEDLMAAVAEDQVTKTKLILYQSITDVVQLTLTIFPVFIHHPGTQIFSFVFPPVLKVITVSRYLCKIKFRQVMRTFLLANTSCLEAGRLNSFILKVKPLRLLNFYETLVCHLLNECY